MRGKNISHSKFRFSSGARMMTSTRLAAGLICLNFIFFGFFLDAMEPRESAFLKYDDLSNDEFLAINTYEKDGVKVVLVSSQDGAEKDFYMKINEIIKDKAVIYESIELTFEDHKNLTVAEARLSSDYQAICRHLDFQPFVSSLGLFREQENIDLSCASEAIHGDITKDKKESLRFERSIREENKSELQDYIYAKALALFDIELSFEEAPHNIEDPIALLEVLIEIEAATSDFLDKYRDTFGTVPDFFIEKRIGLKNDLHKGMSLEAFLKLQF